jgi:serine/threonine protein phosphatase PrpC
VDEVAFAVAKRGRRETMEDTHVLSIESTAPMRLLGAVFDGHGGSAVSQLAARRFEPLFRSALPRGPEEALRSALLGIHDESRGTEGGAVAAAFWIAGGRITVANAGDAHVVAVTGQGATRLTEPHRLDNAAERARIAAAGGAVDGLYVFLPDGRGLTPTRSLGDHAFSAVGVLAEPAVSTHPLEEGWVVAGCDGLWDFVRPDEVPRLLQDIPTARRAALHLTRVALDLRDADDNITVLAVKVWGKRGRAPTPRAPTRAVERRGNGTVHAGGAPRELS